MHINIWIGSFSDKIEKARKKISVLTSLTGWDGRVVLKLFSGICCCYFQLCERGVAKIHWLRHFCPLKGENGSAWAWNMRVHLKERAKATPFGFCLQHCLHQLRNSSPKIYSCYDCQLYSQLQISHKIERGRERGNYKDLKFGKISRVVGGSLLSVEYWQSGWLFVKRGRENPNISDQQTNIRTSRQGPITRGVGGR